MRCFHRLVILLSLSGQGLTIQILMILRVQQLTCVYVSGGGNLSDYRCALKHMPLVIVLFYTYNNFGKAASLQGKPFPLSSFNFLSLILSFFVGVWEITHPFASEADQDTARSKIREKKKKKHHFDFHHVLLCSFFFSPS